MAYQLNLTYHRLSAYVHHSYWENNGYGTKQQSVDDICIHTNKFKALRKIGITFLWLTHLMKFFLLKCWDCFQWLRSLQDCSDGFWCTDTWTSIVWCWQDCTKSFKTFNKAVNSPSIRNITVCLYPTNFSEPKQQTSAYSIEPIWFNLRYQLHPFLKI